MKSKLIFAFLLCLGNYMASALGISGATTVCLNGTSTYTVTGGTGGGTWNSANTAIATISASGVVSGISGGTVLISYTESATATTVTKSITISPVQAITGNTNVCPGSTSILSGGPGGSSWSSANPSIATINAGSGTVTGVSVGTTTMTFNAGSCYSTTTVVVNPLPASITGSLVVCPGTTSSLASADAGGTWVSSATTFATVSGSGVVTGAFQGTSNISYTLSTGCRRVVQVTVNTPPNSITGVNITCVNSSFILSDNTLGGTWSSSNTAVADISSTGVSGGFEKAVTTGLTTGTSTITYTGPNGCYKTLPLTVNAAVTGITGTLAVCTGTNSTLSNPTSGGTWSSSNLAVGTINSGIFRGLTAGTTTISYTITSTPGCRATAIATVNQTPPPITVPSTVHGGYIGCIGLTYNYTDATSGGVWSSSNTTTATIDPATGVATPLAIGSTNISYTMSSGCYAKTLMTVAVDSPLLYETDSVLCVGGYLRLKDASSVPGWGGKLTSANTDIAVCHTPTDWIILGIATGTTTITYTQDLTGCVATKIVTVTQTVGEITGTTSICLGATSTLHNSDAGGRWYSANTAVATIGKTTGVVTGVSTGTALISYVVANSFDSCYNTTVVTINPMPSVGSITGTASVCLGATTNLSDATPGGVWSSANTAIATVDNITGVVTGVAAGTVVISYVVTTGCGAATATKTVTVSSCCHTNSIVINTGYDPTTNSAIAGQVGDGGTAVTDPKWIVSAISPATTAAITALPATAVTVDGSANVMDPILPEYGAAWATHAGCSWITAQNAHGYRTDGTGPTGTHYAMKLSRPFATIAADSIRITFNSSVDNYIDTLIIDDTVFLMHQAETDLGHYGFFSDADHFDSTVYLGAGCHKLNFLVVNYNLTEEKYNPTGMNLYGTLSSAHGNYSVVSEDDAECYATACGAEKHAANSAEHIVSSGEAAIFPNPNKGTFSLTGYVAGMLTSNEAKVEITDMLGRVVYNKTITVQKGYINEQISLGNTVQGIYIVRIAANGTSKTIKCMISK